MHDLKKVYDVIHKDYCQWELDGDRIDWCSYIKMKDNHILALGFDGCSLGKRFVSKSNKDHSMVEICFHSPTHIKLKVCRVDGKTVSYTLKKKE